MWSSAGLVDLHQFLDAVEFLKSNNISHTLTHVKALIWISRHLEFLRLTIKVSLGFIMTHSTAQCLVLCVATVGIPCVSNAQTPAEDVAAQVRQQGYRCDQPIVPGGMLNFPDQTRRSGF